MGERWLTTGDHSICIYHSYCVLVVFAKHHNCCLMNGEEGGMVLTTGDHSICIYHSYCVLVVFAKHHNCCLMNGEEGEKVADNRRPLYMYLSLVLCVSSIC